MLHGSSTPASTYVHFDTSRVAPREGFDYWRDRVVPLRLEPLEATPSRFEVRADVLRGRRLSVIEMTRGPARATWRRATGVQQDRLRLIMIAPAAGAAASWYDTVVRFEHGGVVLAGASDGWWRAPAGMHGIEVDLPRDAVAVSDAELACIHADHRLSADPIFRTLVRPMLAGMAGNLQSLVPSAGDDLATCWTSVLTMLVRSLTQRDLAGTDLVPARRVQAERYIQTHLSDPGLAPNAIAAALGLSRRALYNCLPGVASHIRLARLERARMLLAQGARPVAQVAIAVGLPDPSHFSRLFHAAYGHPPQQTRAR